MKVSALLIQSIFIGTTLFTHFAHANCASVGMMGGCLPSEGMVDVPNHMKSQTANRVTQQKQTAPNTPSKASNASASKKTANGNVTVASSAQNPKQ